MRRFLTYCLIRIVVCFLLCTGTACLYLTLPAYAFSSTPSVLREGTFATCKWEYRQEKDDVALYIYPANGSSGTLTKWEDLLSLPPWSLPSREYSQKAKRVVVANTVKATSCERMFEGFSRVETIDLSGLDTQGVTSMKDMFADCPRLKRLDVSKFDTSHVKDMSGMFRTCLALTSVGDISGWDTSAVTDMNHMFSNCNRLSSLAVDTWDTAALTDMSGLFNECHFLASLDLSRWNTSAVTNMKGTFASCHVLTSAGDLSTWNTARVTNMSCLFFNNPISVDGIGGWNTSAVEDMSFMFSRHHKSALPDLSRWNTAAVKTMRHAFSSSHDLVTLSGLSTWDTAQVTDMSDLFSDCPNLTSLDDLSTWNTAAVKKMSYLFSGCHSLTALDLSSWTVSAACDTSAMFRSTYSLKSIRLAHTFHISKDMGLDDAEANTKVHWEHVNRASSGIQRDPRDAIFLSIDELINFHNDAAKEKTAVEEYVRKVTVTTFVVTFDKGAEDATGTMNPQVFSYNETKTLTKNAFQRAGYEFSGWRDSEGHFYADEESFKIAQHASNRTSEIFTALWKIRDARHENLTGSSHRDLPGSSHKDLLGSSHKDLPGSSQKDLSGSSYKNPPDPQRRDLPGTIDSSPSIPHALTAPGSTAIAIAVALYLYYRLSSHQKTK